MRPAMSLRERAQVQALYDECAGIPSMAALTLCARNVGVEMPETKIREVWGEGRGATHPYFDGQMVQYCRFYQLFEHAKRESIQSGKVDDLALLTSELGDRDVEGVLSDFGLKAQHNVLAIPQEGTPSKGKVRRRGRNDSVDWWACVEEGDWVSGSEVWACSTPQASLRTKKPLRVPPKGTLPTTPKQEDIDASDDDVEEPTRRVEDHGCTLAILSRLGVDTTQYSTSAPPSRRSSLTLPPRPGSSASNPSFMGPKQKMPAVLTPIPRPQSRSQSRPQSRSRPASALSFVDRMHEDVLSRRVSAPQPSTVVDTSFTVPVVHSGACIAEPPQPFPINAARRPASPYAASRPTSAVPFTADYAAIHPSRCVPTRITAQSQARRSKEKVLPPDVLHRIPFDLCPAARHRDGAPSRKVHAAVPPNWAAASGDEDPMLKRWLSGGQLRTGA